MQYLANILLYFNTFFVPIYMILRIKKNKSLAFLNPCIYLLITSYLYLTVASLLFELNQEIMGGLLGFYLNFKEDSLLITDAICNWFVFVFLIYYVLSKDRNLIISEEYKPKRITAKIAFFFTLFISAFFLVLIVIYGPRLVSLSFEEARAMVPVFTGRYRYKVLSLTLAAAVTILVWRTKKVKWYLFLILTVAIDLLTRSRGRAMFIVIFSYVNYVAIFRKLRLKLFSFLLIGILSTFFLRKSLSVNSAIDLIKIPMQVLGEVFNTRATTTIVYDNFLNQGSLTDYILYSFTKTLPGIVGNLIEELIWSNAEEVTQSLDYQSVIGDYYGSLGVTWGLAGNIASEALYFGGIPFAIISPLIIGGIFYLFHELRLNRTLPSFLFLSILIAELPRGIMRNTFYDTFFTIFYVMFSYLIWVTWLEGKRIIFKTSKRQIPLHKFNLNLNQDNLEKTTSHDRN